MLYKGVSGTFLWWYQDSASKYSQLLLPTHMHTVALYEINPSALTKGRLLGISREHCVIGT